MMSNNPDLDALITSARAGIIDLLKAAGSATDPEQAVSLTDEANRLSYNLSADLAECWPGDAAPRKTAHFEAGLAAANDCIKWRHELNKGPWSFSIAWWAKGTHELSLGRTSQAVESYRKSLHYAETVLAEKEEKQDPDADFGVVLAKGYLGLALTAAGDATGNAVYNHACDAFKAIMAVGGERGQDAQFGLDQCETMRSRITARGVLR